MNPLPDRVVIAGLALTIALCFLLAFLVGRRGAAPSLLQWRERPPAVQQERPLI
jgi:hypothetical protein